MIEVSKRPHFSVSSGRSNRFLGVNPRSLDSESVALQICRAPKEGKVAGLNMFLSIIKMDNKVIMFSDNIQMF